jgi:hypothetical protein
MSTSNFHRQHCVGCGAASLELALSVSSSGTPHGTAKHHFAQAHHCLVFCRSCQQLQLEVYSHDCYSYDEPPNLYWFYRLRSADWSLLKSKLSPCCSPATEICPCSRHLRIRTDVEKMYGGVRGITSPDLPVEAPWLCLTEDSLSLRLLEPPK